MRSEKVERTSTQMRRGVLELCILSLISEQEMYPSDILARLETAKLIVVEGTLYPLLTRLKNEGLLAYSWQESNQGPPRKYYQLTDEGREFLADLTESWTELVQSVDKVTKNSH
ncbi:MAG: PadR family transcriptional regulator [Lewinellaceae bacterium]|nr:PadR family transcriptional regulator [Lewinella sp.]MCB9278063.1 PadR family transcriptional regulator [Lewinellaceae bacterium]